MTCQDEMVSSPTEGSDTVAHEPATASDATTERTLAVVRRFWGFSELRPLQADAIRAGLRQRDSLVVMPTGGGKSLCYQVPPVLAGRTDVIVSPLISLMKDQVDALRSCGYPAAAVHSGMDSRARHETQVALRAGKLHLLFVAPERLMTESFIETLKAAKIRSFAVDEGHCISHWGHDFRPEYRQLATLRHHFPEAGVHAFTATATPRVREDIVRQLELVDPLVLVGEFDRSNLVYRILPQVDLYDQVLEVVRRHENEAVIIYCLSRNDTETIAAMLTTHEIKAAYYHAGMDADLRRSTQDAFAAEELDVVVATVAFGMGIDRSNVRCVLHATMPKSIEHYQQETGRAGRDGLEAECVLLYSASDVIRWKSLIQLSAENAEQPEALTAAQEQLLRRMQALCNTPRCRHQMLTNYFGQRYEKSNCGACDVCLNEVEGMEDATVTAQKILSCVARTGQSFGVGHIVEVLLGANTEQIRRFNHDEISTYALLREVPKKQLISMVYQLVDQNVLERTDGDRPILHLNDESWLVMRGQRSVRLLKPKRRPRARTQIEADAWQGVDRDLFEHLRDLRRHLTAERGVKPYVIFEDSTLRNLARIRPTTLEGLRRVRGIGEKRATDFGPYLVEAIETYCRQNNLEADNDDGPSPAPPPSRSRPNPEKENAFRMFAEGRPIDQVATATGRAYKTTVGYLVEWIESHAPTRIDCWVDEQTYERVARAAADTDRQRLKPIFERLDGQASYDEIRLVVVHLKAGTGLNELHPAE